MSERAFASASNSVGLDLEVCLAALLAAGEIDAAWRVLLATLLQHDVCRGRKV
jgi:hypothetical protein